MDGKTHLATGILTGVSVVYVRDKFGLDISEGILLVTGCGIGALLPDIDISNSLLGRFIPLWLFVEHRTITHSLLFMLVVCLLGLILKIPYSLNIGLLVGISTHLVLDGLTPMGIPYLLYPFH